MTRPRPSLRPSPGRRGRRKPAPLGRGVGEGLLLLLLALAACAAPEPVRAPDLLAAYRAPDVPPACREAVYDDPKVRELMIAGAGAPSLRAENQDKLAFLQDEALRRCLQEKGLRKAGVEPVKYKWYPSPF